VYWKSYRDTWIHNDIYIFRSIYMHTCMISIYSDLFFSFFLFFSRASDEWIPRKPKKIFVVWRFAMSVYVTNRLMKKDNAIVCRYASKYNLLILLLVCWRPKIESADRPLNTGSTSNQQDFPDKRLIKSFIPSVFVRASMVQMSPSCELTYYVRAL